MSRQYPRIYLGGSISESPDGEWGNEWREWSIETYQWLDLVNPLDTEDPMHDEYTSTYYADLIETDLDLIDSCDAFLYYYEDTAMSIGTGQEQFYAWNMGHPIVVVYDGDPAELSPFVIAHCDIIVGNIEVAIEELERLIADMYLAVEDPSGWLDKHASSKLGEWETFFAVDNTTEILMHGPAEGYYEEL